MSGEKNESKCCSCCKGTKTELNNEQLDKVSGGRHWENGKYICQDHIRHSLPCLYPKTVDGIANVCTCPEKTSSKCCEQRGDNCTCIFWDKKYHHCTHE